MPISGLISHFSSASIRGWARYTAGSESQTEPIDIVLNIRDHAVLTPTEAVVRSSDGATEFEFRLPKEIQQLPWHTFLDRFNSVVASRLANASERSALPFYKSVLGAVDPDNCTALLAERRREYSITPKPEGRLAAFTIVYNEHRILPLWARYYADVVGAENIFILDQGSDGPYLGLPDGVTVIRLPRDSFDNWLIMRLVATFQRHLLESYDAVLYSDSDEFLCVSPEALSGATLKSFLLSLPDPVGITCGYNLIHDIAREYAIDPSRPVLEQRRFIMRTKSMDKPMISRIPLNWVPGFHSAREGGTVVPGMYMLHLRWYDLDSALEKGNHYRNSKWNPFDIKTNTGAYQRDSAEDIISLFRDRSDLCSKILSTEFDPNAERTIVPDWMRHVITI